MSFKNFLVLIVYLLHCLWLFFIFSFTWMGAVNLWLICTDVVYILSKIAYTDYDVIHFIMSNTWTLGTILCCDLFALMKNSLCCGVSVFSIYCHFKDITLPNRKKRSGKNLFCDVWRDHQRISMWIIPMFSIRWSCAEDNMQLNISVAQPFDIKEQRKVRSLN